MFAMAADWSGRLPDGSVAGMSKLIVELGRVALFGLTPFVVALAVFALITNAIQARGVFSIHPIRPKLSHISPFNGVKRIASLQSLFNLVKSVLKLTVLIGVAYAVLSGAWADVLSLGLLAPADMAKGMMDLMVKLTFIVGLVFGVIAIADYLFQVFQYERQLRMTRHEVTQEMKETDGDPLMKSRIRSFAMAMRRKRMLTEVPRADVVVTNPTRLAVALRYDPARASAPVVVAMGARKLAARIREIAEKSGVPIVENKPLAQALMATARVGEPVPSALYVAVAEILAFVYRQRAERTGRRAGVGAR